MIGLISLVMFGCSDEEVPEDNQEAEGYTLPQLSGDFTDAATMILVSAPPPQPKDHIDRWNPDQQQNSCLTCHENEATGAKSLPDDHFIDGNRSNDVYRTYCIQCHAEQIDDKPAFNREADE